MFKCGKIVELNVGFKLVPVAGKKFKMLPTIRAIALLSVGPMEVSEKQPSTNQMTNNPRQRQLKEQPLREDGRKSMKRRISYEINPDKQSLKRQRLAEMVGEEEKGIRDMPEGSGL